MTLRDAFFSKAAAFTVAAGLAYGGAAMAQEAPAPVTAPDPVTTSLQQSPAGESVSSYIPSRVEFNPLLPYESIGGLAVLAALLAGYAATRRTPGTHWRALFAATAVGALTYPGFINEERERLSTVVPVVVDHSPSVTSIEGRGARIDAAMEAVMRQLGGMENVEVRLVDVTPGQGQREDGTRLFSALETTLSDISPDRLGATIFITDGQAEDVPSAPDARLGGAPVHALVAGDDTERDRRIVFETQPRYGVVDEEISFSFRVEDGGGAADGTPVSVVIRNDGNVLETREVRTGEYVTVTMTVPHAGPNLVELEAETLAGELTTVNNRIVAEVDGVRDRLKVLLISGTPTQGERVLRNTLKSDPSVDLTHFTILRPPDKTDFTPTNETALVGFPTQELFQEQLADFDLVIFDRYHIKPNEPIAARYFEMIAQYVEEGGALLTISGPEYAYATSIARTPVGRVLPVTPSGTVLQEGFRPDLSDDGHRHPVTRDLPHGEGEEPGWGRWFRQAEAGEVRGDVVLEGIDGRPLLVLNRVGEGRAAQLLSDSYHLWARGFEGGGPYAETLRRTAHWLMQEYELEEEQLRLRSEEGDVLVERQSMEDTVDPVTLISPSGARQTVTLEPVEGEPGIFRARVPATERGLYRAEQGDRIAVASAGEPDEKEFADTRATTERFTPLAGQTGGYVNYTGSDGLAVPDFRQQSAGDAMSGESWAGIRMTDATILKSAERNDLPFYLLLGLSGLFGVLAWRREGNQGNTPKAEANKDKAAAPKPAAPAPQ